MRTIIDNRTYKTERSMNRAIERETAKHGEVESTIVANEDGTFTLTISIASDEPVEVEIPRKPDGSIDTGQTDEELAAEAAENAKIDAQMAGEAAKAARLVKAVEIAKVEIAKDGSKGEAAIIIEAVEKAAKKIAQPRSIAILPAVNAPAFASDNPKHRGSLRMSSKVGQIVEAGANMGVRASDLLPIFVKKNGEAWSRASIDCVLRWDVPAKGYSVQCVEDPAGIDHVYVVRPIGLEVDDLAGIEEHWFAFANKYDALENGADT